MSELLDKKIGAEAGAKVEFADGQLKVTLTQDGEIGGAQVVVYLKAKAVLEVIKAKVPGSLDDMLIDAAEASLGL